MFYHLFYQLLSTKYSYLNVFRYQTFRGIAAFLFCFIVVLIAEPYFISWLLYRGIKGQPIRELGPKDHEVKRGTPTMGGLVIVGAVTLSGLLFCDLSNLYVWLVLGVLNAFGFLGFIDDWRKVTKQDSAGLSERGKLIGQALIAGVALIILYSNGFSTALQVPIFKSAGIPLGFFFLFFGSLVIIATSNAVNITDGLDGLAIGPVMTVAATYAIFAYVSGHRGLAEYLQVAYVAELGEVSIILSAIIAAGLGFLWYNTFPAQVFMGDTGAMALGGALGCIAVLAKQELILIIAGGIFVMEAASVLIQRYYYKLTKKRIFRMAPIHHHFELSGWVEPKIIVRFWIISIVLALLSLATLKLR
jgi:phospho-N-acetylmuramoyl-pentapeptide-transferase